MAWIFTTDGNYVNFNGGGNLWRLHKDSNCISWHWDETGDLFFDVYDQEYTVKAGNIADVIIDGVPLSAASGFPAAIQAVFTGLPAGSPYLVYANVAAFPATGEADKVYLAEDTGATYQWDGANYVGLPIGYIKDGGNVFGAYDNGADGIGVYANMLGQGDTEAGWSVNVFNETKYFIETGFYSDFYREPALWYNQITGASPAIRTKASGNADSITLSVLSMPSQAILFQIEIDGTTGYKFSNVPEYADNAAAVSGGLPVGGIYHTAGAMKIVTA